MKDNSLATFLPLQEILKHLYAGKTLLLNFDTPKEREMLRQRLYKAKKPQDAILSAVLDEERMVLRCTYIDENTTDGTEITAVRCAAKFWLENKPSQEFAVTILDEQDGDETSKETKVSASVGEDSILPRKGS